MVEVKEEDTQYVVTVPSRARRDVYFIDKALGLITKSELYENGNLSLTYEWRNIKLNTGLTDDLFEFKLPPDAKQTFKDMSPPKKIK